MPIIRPLTAADSQSYKALRLLAVKTSPTSLWPTYEEVECRSLEETAARIETTETQTVFGAFDGNVLVGITGLRREPLVQIRHKATIWGVFVDPAHRRKGIAQALLNAAVGHASTQWDSAQLLLCVNAVNGAAKKLYESLGFAVFGVEPRALRVDGRFYDEEHMYRSLK